MKNCSKKVSSDWKLVLDASVLINLQASNFGEQVIKALPYEVVTTQNVANELNSSTGRKLGSYQFLCRTNANALVSIAKLNESEYRLYIDLTSLESSRSLDVGEASVIALSKLRYLHGKCIPVIDEKKGSKAAREILNGKKPANSLNLFLNPAVISALGEKNTCDAIYNALRIGRMNIPVCCVEHVVDMIGKNRAMECTSLPGYKNLFSKS